MLEISSLNGEHETFLEEKAKVSKIEKISFESNSWKIELKGQKRDFIYQGSSQEYFEAAKVLREGDEVIVTYKINDKNPEVLSMRRTNYAMSNRS